MHGTTHVCVSVNFCKSPEVSSMYQYWLGANFLPALHHWCKTPCPAHPFLFVGTHAATTFDPFSCSPYSEVDPFTHLGNGGQRRFCGIQCGCHQTSLGQPVAFPGTSVPISALPGTSVAIPGIRGTSSGHCSTSHQPQDLRSRKVGQGSCMP